MSPVLLVLVLCALMLLFFGVLLLVGVGVLAFALGRGGDEEMTPLPAPVRAAKTPPPAPPPFALGGGAPLDPSPVIAKRPEEVDGMKTEVFTRGSLSLDWDEEDEEENATEIFRAGEDFDFN